MKILLATDLSARSDRALDRAALLTRQLDAELVVVHVLERHPEAWPPPRASLWTPVEPEAPSPRLREIVFRHVRAAAPDAGGRVQVRIETGNPPDTIVQVAQQESCDLIVTGVGRNEFLGRFTAGKTVDRVLRSAQVPVLVVTDRPHEPYRRIVVAVDFSDASREGLETALALFPRRRLTVFHASDIPYASFVDDAPAARAAAEDAARTETGKFLAGAGFSPEVRAGLDILVRDGAPDRVLGALARDGVTDLVVLGTRGRGPVLNALLGSVATRIVAALPCDALVVPARRSR